MKTFEGIVHHAHAMCRLYEIVKQINLTCEALGELIEVCFIRHRDEGSLPGHAS